MRLISRQPFGLDSSYSLIILDTDFEHNIIIVWEEAIAGSWVLTVHLKAVTSWLVKDHHHSLTHPLREVKVQNVTNCSDRMP